MITQYVWKYTSFSLCEWRKRLHPHFRPLLLRVPVSAVTVFGFFQHSAFPRPGGERREDVVTPPPLLTEAVRVCLQRQAPPSARGAGAGAGKGTCWGAPAGFRGHDLAVHRPQQQHQTHGPEHVTRTGRRHLRVQQHRCHCRSKAPGEGEAWWLEEQLGSGHFQVLCDVLTLHEVQKQDGAEDGSGGHLDPPLEEEWKEQHSDEALPGQGRPGTLWLGFAECGSWMEEREHFKASLRPKKKETRFNPRSV